MDHRVVVVGAGPAGALLSWLLASRGVDTLLIERQSDFDREFRGEILMPSGVRALESAGVDMDSLTIAPVARIEGFLNKERFLSVDMRPLPPPHRRLRRPPYLRQLELAPSSAARRYPC